MSRHLEFYFELLQRNLDNLKHLDFNLPQEARYKVHQYLQQSIAYQEAALLMIKADIEELDQDNETKTPAPVMR